MRLPKLAVAGILLVSQLPSTQPAQAVNLEEPPSYSHPEINLKNITSFKIIESSFLKPKIGKSLSTIKEEKRLASLPEPTPEPVIQYVAPSPSYPQETYQPNVEVIILNGMRN